MSTKDTDWPPFEDVDFSDEKYLQYHVDTRDFHCSLIEEATDHKFDLHTLSKYPKEFFYTGDEVKELIARYFEESGGVREWRYLVLGQYNCWEMKYIRIYRVEQGLIVCNKDNYALRKSITEQKSTTSEG